MLSLILYRLAEMQFDMSLLSTDTALAAFGKHNIICWTDSAPVPGHGWLPRTACKRLLVTAINI
jgi:hypothetical protein